MHSVLERIKAHGCVENLDANVERLELELQRANVRVAPGDLIVPDALLNPPRHYRLPDEWWDAGRLTCVGVRGDGYTFWGYKTVTPIGPNLMVLAGCRAFWTDEAQRHWAGWTERRVVSQQFVNAIVRWGASKPRIPVYDKVHVQEFLGPRLTAMLDNWLRFERGQPSERTREAE